MAGAATLEACVLGVFGLAVLVALVMAIREQLKDRDMAKQNETLAEEPYYDQGQGLKKAWDQGGCNAAAEVRSPAPATTAPWESRTEALERAIIHLELEAKAQGDSPRALYAHLQIERVRVTEEVLDGLKRLAVTTREEMRKTKSVPAAK